MRNQRFFPTEYRTRLAAIVALYVVIQLAAIALLPLTHEESLNILLGQLAATGYGSAFTPVNPFFAALAAGLSGVGLPLWALKAGFSVCGAVLVLNVAAIARSLFDDEGSLAAAIAAATAVALSVNAAQILPVIPALALATLSLVLTLRSTNNWVAIFAGGIWALALGLSGAALTVLVPLLLLTAIPRRRALAVSGYWAIGATLAGGGLALAFRPEFAGLLADTLTIARALPPDPVVNFGWLGEFAWYNGLLVVPAMLGAATLRSRADHPGWAAIIWLAVAVGWAAVAVTLRLADADTLLPSLALLAGLGWQTTIRVVKVELSRRGNYVTLRRFIVLIGGATIIFAAINMSLARQMVFRTVDTQSDLDQLALRPQVVAFMAAHTSPAECVIVDDAALVVAAQRLPPPALLDLSPEQVQSDLLSMDNLIAQAQTANCPLVVFSQRELSLHLADFEAWAAEAYPHLEQFGPTRIYYR